MWRGKLSRWFRRETFVATPEGNVQGIQLDDGVVCRFVASYKHLAVMTSTTPSFPMEIRNRLTKANNAYHRLLRNVFTQR